MRNTYFSGLLYLITALCLGSFQGKGQEIVRNTVYADGTPSTSAKAIKHYNKGALAANERKYNEAIVHYALAIHEDSLFTSAYDNMGLAYKKVGRDRDAEACFLKSLSINNKSLVPANNLGYLFTDEGNYQKASEYFKYAIQIDPNDGEGYVGYAQCLLRLGDLRNARANAEKGKAWLEANHSPDIGNIYYMLCEINYGLNNKAEALRYTNLARQNGIPVDAQTEEAILSTPTNTAKVAQEAVEIYDQAVLAADAKDIDKAVKLYKKALTLDSSFVAAYDNLGLIYRRRGQVDEAQKLFLKGFESDISATSSAMNLAWTYVQKKNYTKALYYFNIVIQRDDNYAEGYFGIAVCKLHFYDYKGALPFAEKAKLIYEGRNSHIVGDAYVLLCEIYLGLRNKALAMKYLALAKKYDSSPSKETEHAIRMM